MGILEILKSARRAKAQTGRGVFAQLVEIVRLRTGPGKIFPKEYFDLRLYHPDIPREKLNEYVGIWAKPKIYDVQDPQWLAVGNDKLLTYMILKSCGLSFPTVKAVYDPFRTFPGAKSLRSPGEAMAWLRNPANYPFFAKLCTGFHGRGACFADAIDEAGDAIVTATGERIAIEEFARDNFDRRVGGLLFQELIELHPAVEALLGRRVGTARIMTIASASGVWPHRGVFRVPVGANVTDNFSYGQSGNGFGVIDLETGRIVEVLTGVGFNYSAMVLHPDTGHPTADFQLPDWEQALELITCGHRAMPGLRIIGWDIAFTRSGPTVVEINTNSDYFISQSSLRGLADEKFREIFPTDDAARKKLHPHITIGQGATGR